MRLRVVRTLLLAGLVALVCALARATPAAAHTGGKAEPRIAAAVSENAGLVHILTVRLTDLDSGKPVTGVMVTASAEMTRPHLMRTSDWRLAEGTPGLYRARVRFPMPASWTVGVSVSGEDVVAARSQLPVRIERGSGAPPEAEGVPDLTALPTQLEDRLTDRDIVTMIMLWLHGVAAVGWIVAVVVMVLVLSARPGVLAEQARERLKAGYRSWGAWLHWGFVPLIVGTGVYNMLYVTPFPIAWRPGQFSRLAEVPYGPLYEAILIVKLGLFAALLVTGTQVLLRTIRPRSLAPKPASAPGFVGSLTSALGPAGLFYVASVPLILAAAVALRYVHILSHVGTVVSSS